MTLAASNVQSVPSALPVLMRDETTGQVVDLRSGGRYTYSSAADETRRFTFSAGELESTGFAGLLSQVTYPAACLVSRMMDRPLFIECLRATRDLLLRSSLGRVCVSLYYSLPLSQ